MFEEKLKRENPQQKKITYDISDLFSFIDKLTDLAALVSETKHKRTAPKGSGQSDAVTVMRCAAT